MSSTIEPVPELFQLVADAELADEETIPPWSEEEVVLLHWRLLRDVRALDRPGRSLEEKIDILCWVFADGVLETRPFSFVNCLRVVGCSPLSPLDYMGVIDVDEVRNWIQQHLRKWFLDAFAAYPHWVREAIANNPEWVASRLSHNPQWLNQQLRESEISGDLFA